MKINLNNIDQEQFFIIEGIIANEKVYLIQPKHIAIKWTKNNKIFRSSIWNSEGELISAGLPKFVNYGESPEEFPVPKTIKRCIAIEKIDGSLLIVSKYKGQLILRTRGTIDAFIHDNADELTEFKEEIADNIDASLPNLDIWPCSYLFEWISPTNRIILNYGDKPQWYLVGQTIHDDYSLSTQENLDGLAKHRNWKRPKTYKFESIDDLIKEVEEWKNLEGVCLYSNIDQTIHKIKSIDYLLAHRFKSEISNIEKLIDIYLTWNMPSYEELEKKINDTFDFEIFNQIRGDISRIIEAKKEANNIVEHMLTFISPLKNGTRRDAALDIISAYGQTVKKGIAFTLLDGKIPDNRMWKTLMMQCLK